MADTKICPECLKEYERPANARNWVWKHRKYCSRACGARAVMRDPEHRKKCGEGVRARLASDPEVKARHTAAARANIAKGQGMSDRKKSGATRSRNTLGWIPDPETRKHYIRLREEYGAASAKLMLKEAIEAGAKRQVLEAQAEMQRRHDREREQRY